MRNGFLPVVLCAVVMLAGCGKSESKPAEKPAAPTKAQTAYGSAMEKAKSTDCLTRMAGLRPYLMMGDTLPASREEFAGFGCPDEMLNCPGGERYEFLVKGKVRNAGKVPVLRCPTHDLVLYSDGTASTGR